MSIQTPPFAPCKLRSASSGKITSRSKKQMDELKRGRTPPENAALEERVADLTRIVTEERAETTREREGRAEDRFQIRVAEIGAKNGVRQEAVNDMVSRAKASGFRVEADGTVAAFRGDNAIMSKRDPSVRLTLTEWMHDQRKDGGGHLFKAEQGKREAGRIYRHDYRRRIAQIRARPSSGGTSPISPAAKSRSAIIASKR